MSSAISEFLFKQNLYFKTILFNKSSSSKYRLKITPRAGNINIFSVHPHVNTNTVFLYKYLH